MGQGREGIAVASPCRELGFDSSRFMRDVCAVASSRGMSIWDVATETGVSNATMSRMKNHGRMPLAPLLAALCWWAGLDAADYATFYGMPRGPRPRPVSARNKDSQTVTGPSTALAHAGAKRSRDRAVPQTSQGG